MFYVNNKNVKSSYIKELLEKAFRSLYKSLCALVDLEKNIGVDNRYVKSETEVNNKRMKLEEDLIKKGFKSQCELSQFNNGQLICILRGLEANVDVSVYAKPEYEPWQMDDTIETLLSELGEKEKVMEIFREYYYTWSQQLEIIKGVSWAIGDSGAKIYATPIFDWQQMRNIRLALTEKRFKKGRPLDLEYDEEISKLDPNLYNKPKYTEDEVKELAEHEKRCIKKRDEILSKHNFRWWQEVEILKGIDNNVDVCLYAKPEFNSWKMREMRLILKAGLKNNTDTSCYVDSKFNSSQLAAIRKGIESGVDVSVYADPEISDNKMEIMRFCLEQGLDISLYTNPKFNDNQLEEIKRGLDELNDRLDILCYVDSKFNASQMGAIRRGLESGVDVSVYADPKISDIKMEIMRMCLEQKLDISLYTNPEFSDNQLKEIEKGLYDQVDVSVYANPKFDSEQMQSIRCKLGCNSKRKDCNLDISRADDLENDEEEWDLEM